MHYLQAILLTTIFSFELVYPGCGGCKLTSKKINNPTGNFVLKIGENNAIQGAVLCSYGMCKFGMNSRDYSQAIQIDKKNFPVRGTSIDDHGQSHDENAFYYAIRVADVNVKVIDGFSIAKDFKLKKTK